MPKREQALMSRRRNNRFKVKNDLDTHNIVFLIAVTYVHVTFGTLTTKNTAFSDYTLCTTDECINAASKILDNLDPTVDPCDNFYKFACGGWIQNNPVNNSVPYVFLDSEVETENQLRELLEEPAKPGDTMSFQKAKHIFAQCMDNENGEQISINDFSALVSKYVKWPLDTSLRNWEKGNLTWQNFSISLLENGFDNGLFDIQVMEDFIITSHNRIAIEPYSNMIHNIELSSLITTYKAMLPIIENNFTEKDESIACDLVEKDGENITRDVIDVATFARELADLKDSHYFGTFRKYITRTIQELQKAYDEQHPETNGKIDWHLTIQSVFAPEGIAIKTSEKLLVPAYNYLLNLVPLLRRTPSRTIVNYMKMTFFLKFSPYAKRPKADFITRDMMHADSTQQGSDDTRWKSCLYNVNLESAISHEYVKKYTSHINIDDIREIGEDVRDAVEEQIRQSTWMDERTKQASLEKLAYLKQEFIKPDWYSDEAIDRYYEDLNVSMEYFENIMNILKFKRKMMLSLLRAPADKTLWTAEPTEQRAYSNYYSNKIVVTAAFLQTPTYDVHRIPCMNYGSLGFVIGHEIAHAFGSKGRTYNKDGNAMKWWSWRSINAFETLTQCFVEQYDNYLLPGLEDKNIHMNGRQTLSENIADSTGIASAYYAYEKRKTRLNKTEQRVIGVRVGEYSDDQIFFITYAQFMCANYLPEIVKRFLKSQCTHAEYELRVRGSLSNLREFSEVYNCPPWKPMNPEKKCALWH